MSLSKAIFTGQMNRVIQTFGKENFPAPRMEEIWKVVKDLPDLDFIKVVSRIVGEVPIKYPPTVIQFREFAETKLKELRDSGGGQDWEKVANEISERKKILEAMTPEQREERKQRFKDLAKRIKTV